MARVVLLALRVALRATGLPTFSAVLFFYLSSSLVFHHLFPQYFFCIVAFFMQFTVMFLLQVSKRVNFYFWSIYNAYTRQTYLFLDAIRSEAALFSFCRTLLIAFSALTLMVE